jgi:hypothetical protein
MHHRSEQRWRAGRRPRSAQSRACESQVNRRSAYQDTPCAKNKTGSPRDSSCLSLRFSLAFSARLRFWQRKVLKFGPHGACLTSRETLHGSKADSGRTRCLHFLVEIEFASRNHGRKVGAALVSLVTFGRSTTSDFRAATCWLIIAYPEASVRSKDEKSVSSKD